MAEPHETTDEVAAETRQRGKAGLRRPVALLVIVIVVIVVAKRFGVGEKLAQLEGWIESFGVWGPAVFAALYIVATVAALPGSALTIAGGGLFGSVVGVVTVSIASTTGAGLAFLVSRYLARDAVTRSLSGNEKFRKLDDLTRRRGAIIVAITRLVPLFPFNLLNYGFGLTGVPFWTYLFWSWLCMLPGTILYVVGADAVVTAVSEGRVPWTLVGVVLGVIVLLALVARWARARLHTGDNKAATSDPNEENGGDD